jgi:hypothetical protein
MMIDQKEKEKKFNYSYFTNPHFSQLLKGVSPSFIKI